jgi:hypothetical protein
LLTGIGLRIASCFPQHKFPADSDAVLNGLCALDVRDGQRPLFFPGGYRLSSQSCYVTDAMFHVFGLNRKALAGTSVFYCFLFLLFGWLALREAVGDVPALAGFLLLAFPPWQLWLVMYPPWGYSEIMAFSACTMWIGFRLLRPRVDNPLLWWLLFGISLGFAFWTSPQTLMISGPVIGLLALRKKFSWRSLAAATVAALVAFLPYGLVILKYGLSPFRNNFATQPVSTSAQLVSNAQYLFTDTLPRLLFSGGTNQILLFSNGGTRALLVGAVLVLLAVLSVRDLAAPRKQLLHDVPLWFPIAILLFASLLYVGSGAGAVRGWTVRYAAPAYLAVALAAALLIARLDNLWAKRTVVTCTVMLALLQLIELPIFNKSYRRQQLQSFYDELATVRYLKERHVDVVLGNYWDVYHLNFDSLEQIIALPNGEPEDYFRFARKLKGREVQAALIDSDAAHLAAWAGRLDEPGHVEQISKDVFAFVLEHPIDAKEIETARARAQ